jgi:uncharacterized repeat protein (TIGR03803 family)
MRGLTVAGLFLFAVAFCFPGSAQTVTTLYSFPLVNGSTPTSPQGPLLRDAKGNLYGTTVDGGNNSGCPNCGQVYRLSASGTLTVLHSFAASDGEGPEGGLIRDSSGNFYGTAPSGGDLNCTYNSSGCGTVFKIDTSRKFSVLHTFEGTDGVNPLGRLLLDKSGNLYGTTSIGGSTNDGVVYEISASGSESVLLNFDGSNGAYPYGSLVAGPKGEILGTSAYGGSFDQGTVFKLTPSNGSWTQTILYTFGTLSNDGISPDWWLVKGADGSYYGSTADGGGYYTGDLCTFGCGTLFKLTPGANSWTGTILHAFTGQTDGAIPQGIARDQAGNIYGVVAYDGGGPCGCGTIFRYDTSGNFAIVHTFTGSDGAAPVGPMLYDSATGVFYGTTTQGGASGGGTIFEFQP